MRYRKLDQGPEQIPNRWDEGGTYDSGLYWDTGFIGDYTFGQGNANFWIDVRETVAQSVLTRLRLWEGEWFLDVTEGTPWSQSILGKHRESLYDMVLRQRIADTPGVTGIPAYNSILDRAARALTVTATIDTVYGQTQVETVLQIN